MIHAQRHWAAGRTVIIAKGGYAPHPFHVTDWWDRDHGSWKTGLTPSTPNAKCLSYAARRLRDDLPDDDEVVYGRLGIHTQLLHASELPEVFANHG